MTDRRGGQIAKTLDWKYPIKVQSLREEVQDTASTAPCPPTGSVGTDAHGRLTAFRHRIAAQPTSCQPALRPAT
jgi:isoquinoline 1-oxidoreductase beta subunit